jgi:hypothetical protein
MVSWNSYKMIIDLTTTTKQTKLQAVSVSCSARDYVISHLRATGLAPEYHHILWCQCCSGKLKCVTTITATNDSCPTLFIAIFSH